ncbi:hypothetical protein FHS83_002283 [Rhizomicrobium palustre]|uniref:PqqD family protein n=1 Tax=Rhizomicrobium palustre TaxID=189966 RepID=A0A846N0F0_9PROT|nr:PqqD family protein [Rhizomicrobium palustre]NIK88965.1 hypothetical protein [Rhizomicrobium palustre]
MSTSGKWVRKSNSVGAQIDDAYVIVDADTAKYYAFNTSAKDIWDALVEARSCAEICERLTARYDVNADDCLSSVERVVEDLKGKGLVAPA